MNNSTSSNRRGLLSCLLVAFYVLLMTSHSALAHPSSAAPSIYTVTGGGTYCAGGVGVPVDLSGSQLGVNYQLFRGNTLVSNSVPGTGTMISFGNQTSPGSYSVLATELSTSSQQAMAGSVLVATKPTPTPMIVGLDSKFCHDGPAVSLNGSGTGGSYTIDGVKSTTLTPSYLTVGEHTVIYSLTGVNGCVGTASQMVTIEETPQTPKLVTASGQSYPAGVSSLTVSQNTGPVSLSVSGCDGGTINWMGGASTTYAVSTANPGIFSYQASCTRNACTSLLAKATVTVVGGNTTLKVLSRDPDNGQLNSNTIKPYLSLQNDGNTAISYGAITVRYWLTTEANIPLLFQINYAQLGSDKVHLRYVPLAQPRQGATGYIEYSFDASAGSLAAMSNSGPIQNQINKQNYSAFNQLDDYSYVNNGNFTLNPHITAYVNGLLVYGVEPAISGSPRQGVASSELNLQVRLLGNPVVGPAAEVEILGVEGEPVQVNLVNLQGRLVHQQRIEQPTSLERVRVPLGGELGVLLLEVSTPTQRQLVKLLKQ